MASSADAVRRAPVPKRVSTIHAASARSSLIFLDCVNYEYLYWDSGLFENLKLIFASPVNSSGSAHSKTRTEYPLKSRCRAMTNRRRRYYLFRSK
jgi:hypothetical protein